MDYLYYKISPLRIFDEKNILKKMTKEDKENAIKNYKNDKLIKIITVSFGNRGYVLEEGAEILYAIRYYKIQKIKIKIDIKYEKEIKQTLLERVQLEIMNPMISAILYEEIKEICDYNQGDISKLVNKTQGAISNKKRLLKLPQEIQIGIIKNKIKERHGRALLQLHKRETFENLLTPVMKTSFRYWSASFRTE